MKKITLLVIFSFVLGLVSNAQDTSAYVLLKKYYAIKEALVEGDSKLASQNASDFLKATTAMNEKIMDATTSKKLAENAGKISGNKDLKAQREVFSPFSEDVYNLAKKTPLSANPVYRQYCPMKKAYWLSNEQVIRNPYYGSMMLSCGKVVETISTK